MDETLMEDKIRLSYLGSFDDEITDKLIGISEFYLENRSELGKLKSKVSFLIAECFQNIVRHGGAKDKTRILPNGHSDFFQINVMEDRVVLTSCNIIKDIYIADLEKKLKQVNSLNADELKTLYKEILENEGFSEKGGAGLGLVEMARKSGLPLKYLFKKLEGEFDQFFMSLEIVGKKDNLIEKVKIESIESFYRKLLHDKVIMFYKGDLSKDIISPVIEMLQHNFEDKDNLSGKDKRSIVTLIETLQNVSKHAKTVNGSKEGIFSIVKTNDMFNIEVGNYIEEADRKILEGMLESLKNMSLEEISTQYKQQLLSPDITPEGNCGLGLLEIARNSAQNYSYSFKQSSPNELFYSLKISL